MTWTQRVRSRVRPLTSAVSAARQDSRRIILSAFLCAVVSFSSALATALTTDPAQIGVFTVVSAGLGGLVAFCQAVLQAWKNET